MSTLNVDDITVVMQHNMPASNVGQWEKGKRIKCSLSEYHLGEGDDRGIQKKPGIAIAQ